MNLSCDISRASRYTSPSQIARVLSEEWVLANMYCLGCSAERLQRTVANTRCLDFTCQECLHKYELKTFLRRPAKSLVDGAYASMMESMRSTSKPTLFLLHRDKGWNIHHFTAIHSAFLTTSLIEARKPLSAKAKRAGWIGCNIRLDRLPPEGEIVVVADRNAKNPSQVRESFRKLAPFNALSLAERGWTSLALSIARRLGSEVFTLQEMYKHEFDFAAVYPHNLNLRPKIRQQLQQLRNLGMIRFLDRGRYQLL